MHLGPGYILLDKYRVERVLGAGGMGVVMSAVHVHLNERVALKFLRPEVLHGDAIQRFLREAQASARLRGEHVARVNDVGITPEGLPYMIMEYLDGGDLGELIARRGALPSGEAVDYALQVCEALAEAHSVGIVHRDIKPANIFVARRPDGSPLVKVLDFGISKLPPLVARNVTDSQAVMGTPSYMSPEQMRSSKNIDERTDIWALGVVLYEAISRTRPFDADNFAAQCFKVAIERPPRLSPALPRGLDAVIYRCLEKDPARRFASMADVARALAPFASARREAATIVERTLAMRAAAAIRPPVSAPDSTTLTIARIVPPPRRSPWRTRLAVALGATVAALASVAGAQLAATSLESTVPPVPWPAARLVSELPDELPVDHRTPEPALPFAAIAPPPALPAEAPRSPGDDRTVRKPRLAGREAPAARTAPRRTPELLAAPLAPDAADAPDAAPPSSEQLAEQLLKSRDYRSVMDLIDRDLERSQATTRGIYIAALAACRARDSLAVQRYQPRLQGRFLSSVKQACVNSATESLSRQDIARSLQEAESQLLWCSENYGSTRPIKLTFSVDANGDVTTATAAADAEPAAALCAVAVLKTVRFPATERGNRILRYTFRPPKPSTPPTAAAAPAAVP
jgi:tRNA A-37 threonylcarbamoyl transferase component Bud32